MVDLRKEAFRLVEQGADGVYEVHLDGAGLLDHLEALFCPGGLWKVVDVEVGQVCPVKGQEDE